MIHAAIVDDVSQDAQKLFTLLTEYGSANNLPIAADCFSSGEAFLQAAQPGRYSLVFLDILMKELNGMETAKRFRTVDPNALLVFVTSESSYAVEGYDVEANGFLIKTFPPDVQAFARLMDRLTAKLNQIAFLDLSDTELKLRIPANTLQYVDVSDHRLAIHTPEEVYYLRMPLEKFKKYLPQNGGFFQCHRGILVNLDWVASLEKEVVLLKTGDVLPVSRRNYHSFVTAQAAWNFQKLREQFP